MIKEAIEKIVTKEDLTYDEAYTAMHEIMTGETTPTQNAAFLAALSTKSTKAETIDEITGCAYAMRELATPVPHPGIKTLEIVGTGGDHAHTFNISTTAALIAASAGVKVTKHGNRAASSASGAADCLEALGANINQDPQKALQMLDGCNMTFLFAQAYHSAMRYVGAIRKELGFRTVFNILGPLTNPAQPEYYVLGVYDEYLIEPIAHVLNSLGAEHAYVVHSRDVMDELSCSNETAICELKDGQISTYTVAPEDFGLARCQKTDLVGGTPAENAQTTRDILEGTLTGPKRDTAVLNAAFCIAAAGIVEKPVDGIALAEEQIESGNAAKTLDTFIKLSNE